MSARALITRALISLAATAVFPGCAATTHVVIASSPLPAQRNLLELRIAHAAIDGNRMIEALAQLSEQIRTQSEGKLRFDYMMTAELERHNRKISIHAQDIRLDALLDEMCRQSGWTYITHAPVLPPGISFFAGSPSRTSPQ